MNSNFIELNELEILDISGGGWWGVAGGVLFVAAGVATGGTSAVALGLVSGIGTIIVAWP